MVWLKLKMNGLTIKKF